ncbi:hypothetical protein N7G274_002953 [Stereocaulon virgatum]|uniref:Uncharacterized protein n=1 Tax=Stereocaulon virgatum TaxID=373712 RepID=A0ABR4AEQ0_9LECA
MVGFHQQIVRPSESFDFEIRRPTPSKPLMEGKVPSRWKCAELIACNGNLSVPFSSHPRKTSENTIRSLDGSARPILQLADEDGMLHGGDISDCLARIGAQFWHDGAGKKQDVNHCKPDRPN